MNQRGRSKSAAKRAAARENGKRGGRPRRVDKLVKRILAVFTDASLRLPDIDPHDLLLILEQLCRGPRDNRAFFMFPRQDGGYDF